MTDKQRVIHYIKANPSATNEELYKQFPNVRPSTIRVYRAALNRDLPPEKKSRSKPKNKRERKSSFRPSNHTSTTQTKDGTEFEYNGTKSIKTLEEAIELFEIDLKVWEVEKFTCSSSEVAARYRDQDLSWKDGVMTGHAKRKNEWDTHVNYHVKLFVRKKKESDYKVVDYVDVYKEMLATIKPFEHKPINYKIAKERNMLEVNIFDLHVGKLCWEGETNFNYDLKIAEKRFMYAMEELVRRAQRFDFERILFPIGNDFFNSDSAANTTYAGTPQNEDGRWPKVFSLGIQLLTKGIDYLRQYAPVDVLVIPGNHDWTRMFYAGETIKAFYRNTDGVMIDNSPNPRKYYRYGNSLIGLTHGDKEKSDDLRAIMALEAKEDWAKVLFREFHCGHWHRKLENRTIMMVKDKKVDEQLAMIVRHMSSLAGTDMWHHSEGYVGPNKAAEALLWNYETGYLGTFNINIQI